MDPFVEELDVNADEARDLAEQLFQIRPRTKGDALAMLDSALQSRHRRELMDAVLDGFTAKLLRSWARQHGYTTANKADAVAALLDHFCGACVLDLRGEEPAPRTSTPQPPATTPRTPDVLPDAAPRDFSRLSPPERRVMLVIGPEPAGFMTTARDLWNGVTSAHREQLRISLRDAHGQFQFDANHPQKDRYYVLNYYDASGLHYFAAEEAVERCVRTKLSMVQQLAVSLGATRIEFRQTSSTESAQRGNASLDYVMGQFGASARRMAENGNDYAVCLELGPGSGRREVPRELEALLRWEPELGTLAASAKQRTWGVLSARVQNSECRELQAQLEALPLGHAPSAARAGFEHRAAMVSAWHLTVVFSDQHHRPPQQSYDRVSSLPPQPRIPAATQQQVWPCSWCRESLRWIPEHRRWWCDRCQRYSTG